MAGLAALDLATDLGEGASIGHVLAEGGILVLGFLGATIIARKLFAISRRAQKAAREAKDLAGRLEKTAADANRWREEARNHVVGLAQAIDEQFERWHLSPAEKEVALLLLKGLSHKEVADVRSVAEATARQQARAVYKKAGLSGRSDLSAFFLEDLLLPPGNTSADRAEPVD